MTNKKAMTKTNTMKNNDNCKNTLKEQSHSQRRVTFETLVTFLTIENNNLNIRSDP